MEVRPRLDAEAVESLGHVAGVVAALVGLAGVALSVVLAEGFSLREQALSELGQAGADTAWLFNGSVVVAGILGAIFAASILRRLAHPLQRVGVAILGLAALGLAAVGIFPMGHALHLPAALLFFVGLTVGLIVTSIGDRKIDRPRRSRISLNLALLHVLAWAFAFVTLEGIALPELIGGIIFAVWIVIVVIQRGRDLPELVTA
ncbi:MAG: DUF998 domain-containing protein [Halobacteriota archaeon]